MLPKFSISIMILLLICSVSFSQETSSDERLTKMQQELDLLKKQMEFEKAKSDLANQRLREIRDSIPKSSVTPLSGRTTYGDEKEANFESITLSFEALKEISVKISADLKTDVDKYSGLVLYNEPDFVSLGKYRLYRSQVRIALKNYELLIELLRKLTFPSALPNAREGGKFRLKNSDPLMTALSIPSIGTSYATSIAELFSVFRSETTITQTLGKVDDASLGAVMANEIKKGNPNVKIYFPQAFVAEYNLDEEGEDSLFRQITQINAANFILSEVILQIAKLPEAEQNKQEIKDTVALAEIVKKQLQSVAIDSRSATATAAETEGEAPKTSLSEFRQLVRAEKLDQFLLSKTYSSAGKVSAKQTDEEKIGILKLRVLSSGGSRRETRNLFLGNKMDFSGSVVVEVFLFDADGELKKSDVYSLHTGFRKMQRSENPKEKL